MRRLEWFGWFTPHRRILEEAFARHQRGENVMLLAIAGDFPVGQIFVDLTRKADESVALLWAFRVLPGFQGAGIGGSLLTLAESVAASHGHGQSEVGVALHNADARRLYERRGYRPHDMIRESVRYRTPEGSARVMRLHELVLRKPLAPRDAQACAG